MGSADWKHNNWLPRAESAVCDIPNLLWCNFYNFVRARTTFAIIYEKHANSDKDLALIALCRVLAERATPDGWVLSFWPI